MYQKLAIISTVATAQLNYNLAKCDANPITSHQYPVSNNDGAARVIPDNGVNGNWVVYGIPDSNSVTGVSAAAPVDCTTNPATGAAYAFGNEVPISCCEAVDGTETQFYQRANAQTGYCSTLPQADAGLGTLSSGPYDGRYWTQFQWHGLLPQHQHCRCRRILRQLRQHLRKLCGEWVRHRQLRIDEVRHYFPS